MGCNERDKEPAPRIPLVSPRPRRVIVTGSPTPSSGNSESDLGRVVRGCLRNQPSDHASDRGQRANGQQHGGESKTQASLPMLGVCHATDRDSGDTGWKFAV